MSSEVDSFLTDFFRSPSSSSFPGFYLLLTIVTIILISGPRQVFASHDLTINRMQHYDIERIAHGSRNSIINLDLTTLSTLSRSFAKKCVLIHLVDLINSTDTYKTLISEPAVGGMLILVPKSFKSFSSELRSKVIEMENFMISQVIDIPIYFAHEEPQLLAVYDEIISLSTSKSHGSDYGKFFESLTKSGYKLFTHASPAKAISAPILTNVEATLLGRGIEDQLPTIMFTAHYDSFGVSPGLSFGSDSNASGMIALLELCRLFSKLYNDRRSHPATNLVFLLTAAGKFNYIGSKKWMEEQDHSKNKIVNDPQLTISLDSLGHQINSDQIFAHVSKAPKENSQGALFIKNLIEMAELKKTNASMIRKKINLANEVLDWEHEKFTIRRMPALTVSSLPGPRSEWRTSITDTAERIDVEILSRNIEIIAESLARLVFKLENISGSSVFREDLAVSRSTVNSLIHQFSSQSRAQQVLLTSSSGSSKYKVSPLLSTLSSILKRYTKNTRFQHFKLDEREPEVILFDQNIVNVSIYNVKPAIFDFLLSIAISFYLGNLYLFLNYFSVIQSLFQSLKFKTSAQNGVAMTKSKVQ